MAHLASDISPTTEETDGTLAADHSDICKRLTFGNFPSAASSSVVPTATSTGLPAPQSSTSSTAASSNSSSVLKDDCQGEALHCFLRIRPFTELEQRETTPAAKIDLFDDGHQIEIHAPEDSATFKNGSRNPSDNSWRFKFSSVLSPSAGQQDVFETTLLENVQDFVTGQNTLVFTYGATNGGKTYTMLGKPSDAGLIPRTLDTIFNSIKDRLSSPYEMKPKCLSLVRLDESSRTQEIKSKLDVLSSWDKREETFTSADISGSIGDESLIPSINSTLNFSDTSSLPVPSNTSSDELSLSFVPEVNTNRQRDSRTRVSIEPQGRVRFSVFVSYAEIYNEMIYDLLDKPPLTKHMRRNALKLSEDKHKRHHIKGLKEIEVRNADEAFKLLQIGQINRQVASTRLNQRSSRSHAIFTIKVLRVVDINDPTYARVSTMSFVDLAGSERNREKEGLRMKEACNINTSLLTLGKCIEIMRFNQRNRCSAQRLVPFRESKLTRLFMGFFQGEGRVTMIVNINQIAGMFDETYRVLRFSALARELVPGGHRPTRLHGGSGGHGPAGRLNSREAAERDPTGDTAKVAELTKLCAQHEGEIDEYRKIVQSLRDELRQAKLEKIELEVNIRREAAEEMANQLIEIEESNQERVAEAVSAVEERHEQQLEILSKSIKRRYVKKRCRPDSDEEFASNLSKFRGQHEAEKWQSKCKDLEAEKLALEEEWKERTHQLEREKSVLQYELSGKADDAMRCEDLSQKCAQLEETVADLQKKLAQENSRYCNLQEEVGRIRHESNEEIQRKNAMAVTIEEQTRELVKARAEIMQLRHEKTAFQEKAEKAATALRSREASVSMASAKSVEEDDGRLAAATAAAAAASDEALHLGAKLEEAQQRLAARDSEHVRELEEVNGNIADISESLRLAQETLESYEEQLSILKEALAQKKTELRDFEERHDAQRQQIQALESAATSSQQRDADAACRAKTDAQRLTEELASLRQEHAAVQTRLDCAVQVTRAERGEAENRLRDQAAAHAAEIKRLTQQMESDKSDHSTALRELQTRITAAANAAPSASSKTRADSVDDGDDTLSACVDDINGDDKENMAGSMKTPGSNLKKCTVMVGRIAASNTVPLESSVDPKDDSILDRAQEQVGEMSAFGDDVVDPDLVYDMETSAHEERDVTPGLGKKRKRFTRQCKKATAAASATTTFGAAAKRPRKTKEPKNSESAVDSDCENPSVFASTAPTSKPTSLVSLITSPFSKAGLKSSANSTDKVVSPLAQRTNTSSTSSTSSTSTTDGTVPRPRTRRKLLGKSQISSPISIAGCGPAMELTSRRTRR